MNSVYDTIIKLGEVAMNQLEQFFAIGLLIQIIHVLEELSTGFNKKWYVFKMPLWAFVIFELVFEGFWIAVYLFQNFPNRLVFQVLFLVLMFANGVQHIVWSINARKYVPGLITAPLHIIAFLMYYFGAIFS